MLSPNWEKTENTLKVNSVSLTTLSGEGDLTCGAETWDGGTWNPFGTLWWLPRIGRDRCPPVLHQRNPLPSQETEHDGPPVLVSWGCHKEIPDWGADFS